MEIMTLNVERTSVGIPGEIFAQELIDRQTAKKIFANNVNRDDRQTVVPRHQEEQRIHAVASGS
jgi:hypothetical protein